LEQQNVNPSAHLVDGSDVMRSAIRQLLKKELGIEVIGTATSFAEILVLTAALKPDVLLMDSSVVRTVTKSLHTAKSIRDLRQFPMTHFGRRSSTFQMAA
jgi:DNA-binding NarL/FixJ family response regulator